MISKRKIQYIRSLQLKKYREKYGEFVVEGPKLVRELFRSNFRVKEIFSTSNFAESSSVKIPQAVVSQTELERISSLKTPNEVLAIAQLPESWGQKFVMPDDFVLLLDEIGDPGNLGTIIRTADWFGIRNIVCSLSSVELFNPKVVQATMGSIFRVRVHYLDPVKFLAGLDPDVPVYGTFLEGSNIFNQEFGNSGVVIIGSESHGISPVLAKHIKNRIHIPAVSHEAESLNASVATAICCSEIRRKQLKNI